MSNPMVPTTEKDAPTLLGLTDEDTESAVFFALGAVSVCWDGEGVFQSERAERIGHELIDHLRSLYVIPADVRNEARA